MLNWEWYDDIPTKVLFFHLLLTVNYEDKKWRGQAIKKGSIITSLGHLAEQTHLSVRNIRTALDKLEKTGEVTRRTTNRFTQITLVNWSKYQTREVKATSQKATKRQSKDKQTTTTKEGKNIKNIRNREATPSQAAEDFFTQPEKQQEVIAYLIDKGLSEDQATSEIQKFILYWTEPNKSGTKERWQMQKTFEVKRRLVTWIRNIRGFNKQETKGITL